MKTIEQAIIEAESMTNKERATYWQSLYTELYNQFPRGGVVSEVPKLMQAETVALKEQPRGFVTTKK